MIMEQKLDINDFYMIEYICSGGDNICSKEDAACPVCGSRTYNGDTIIAEDHWGLPVPSQEECCGALKDEDEGAEHLMRLSGYAKHK